MVTATGRQRVIDLDVDGATVRAHDPVLEVLNFKFNMSLTAYDMKKWEWWEDHPPITVDDFLGAFNAVWQGNLWKATQAYDEKTIPALRMLAADPNVKLTFVTARNLKNIPNFCNWLTLNGLPQIPVAPPPADTKNKKIMMEDKLKRQCDFLLEDNPMLAEAVLAAETPPAFQTILIDTPWNRYVRWPTSMNSRIIRVHDWGQVLRALYN